VRPHGEVVEVVEVVESTDADDVLLAIVVVPGLDVTTVGEGRATDGAPAEVPGVGAGLVRPLVPLHPVTANANANAPARRMRGGWRHSRNHSARRFPPWRDNRLGSYDAAVVRVVRWCKAGSGDAPRCLPRARRGHVGLAERSQHREVALSSCVEPTAGAEPTTDVLGVSRHLRT
jgi:hypothetical protein